MDHVLGVQADRVLGVQADRVLSARAAHVQCLHEEVDVQLACVLVVQGGSQHSQRAPKHSIVSSRKYEIDLLSGLCLI